FRPHAVARMRPQAYQRYVVMRYLDLLIAWGDYYFAQDTIESTNEALTHYLLAKRLLGRRPVRLPSEQGPAKTFNQILNPVPVKKEKEENVALVSPGAEQAHSPDTWLAAGADVGGDDMLVLEVVGPIMNSPMLNTAEDAGEEEDVEPYFCVPPNDKLLSYW